MAQKPEVTVETESTETTVAAVVAETIADTAVAVAEESSVISFGGKWLACIEGEVVTFPTKSEAESALSLAKNKGAIDAEANAYCADRGYTGKNLVGKLNIVTDFLAWKASK